MSTGMLVVTVTSVVALAETVRGLRLARADGADMPPWEPGAHVDLVLPSGLVRQYSLCGDPRELSHYDIAVLREPESRGGSQEVHDVLAVGVEVGIRGPRNRFPLVEAGEYLFLAGGIGITPLLPMVVEADRRGARWRLVYGGRSRASMAFLTQVEGRTAAEIWPQEEVGLLDLAALVTPGGTEIVYCCGPSPLLDAVTARCAEVGRLADLHLERFAASDDVAARAGGGVPFEVQLGAGGPVLAVGPDTSILQTLLDAGIDVLFSCEEGTCGSCETTVLAGNPDHRDELLTDAEREAGSILLCVSRSRDSRLVLELEA